MHARRDERISLSMSHVCFCLTGTSVRWHAISQGKEGDCAPLATKIHLECNERTYA